MTKSIDWKPLLQKNPIFSTVDEKKIDALLADGVSKELGYAKDKDIVRQGEEGDSLFVIGSGSAEALLEVAGEETIHLSTMRKGDVFGEMAFFGGRERAATVRAKEDCTVLEIGGPKFQNLVEEYPDIRSRLLLLMGERLRHTNEQILALHLKTVDEKLKLFNNRLDSEQRSVEAFLKAAQTVFDQTKLRTDEVINSAERSRDRLTKFPALVGGAVALLGLLLGLFGVNKVSELGNYTEKIKGYRDEAETSIKEMRSLKSSLPAVESVTKALPTVERLRGALTGIYRRRFFDALDKDSANDARDAYNQIKDAEGFDDELNALLRGMEQEVVARAHPPSPEQQSNVENFLGLFRQAVDDAKRPRDKLDAYYLRLVYEYLTDRIDFEGARGALKKYVSSATFEKYLKSTSKKARLRTATPELAELLRKPGKRGEDLRKLSDLAFISVASD